MDWHNFASLLKFSPGILGLMKRAEQNTALQERLVMSFSGLIYLAAVGLLLIIVHTTRREKFEKVVLLTLWAHLIGSALVRIFFTYSYDLPFIGPAFQYVDLILIIFLCARIGACLREIRFSTGQTIAAGFVALLSAVMLVYFVIGLPFISIRTANLMSAFFVSAFSIWAVRYRTRLEADFFSITSSTGLIKCLLGLALALPIILYIGAPAPPDNNIVQSGDLLGFAVTSPGLMASQTGFGNEVWQLRYPAGIVGALSIPTLFLASRAAEASFMLWVFSWLLYILAAIALTKHCRSKPMIAAALCLNITVTGSAALNGGQIQELLSYSIGAFTLCWMIQRNYKFGALGLCCCLVLQPVVALPFLIAGTYILIGDIKRKGLQLLSKLYVPVGMVIGVLTYLVAIGPMMDSSNPSQPSILLSELTPALFLTNIIKWLRSDSLGLWPLVIVGFGLLLRDKGIDRRVKGAVLSWLGGALVIDGLFGATKWVVRFQANYSTILLSQVAIGYGLSRIADLPQMRVRLLRYSLGALMIFGWVFANHGPGFRLKPESVFVTHSDVRLMRLADGMMGREARIFNTRPPGEAFGWGSFCRGQLWRPCWNHGYGSHEIAFGNVRGESQQRCKMESDNFIACLKSEGFDFILIASRASSPQFASKLIEQGASLRSSIEASYLLSIK